MQTTRYSVTFHLLPRAHPDGTHSVAMTVTWHRQRYRRTLDVSCPPEAFDSTVQLARPHGAFRNVAPVNTAILDARQQIDDIFTTAALNGRIPSPADLRPDAVQPEVRRTIAAALEEFTATQSRERSWQPGTAVKFAMLGRELAACGITYLDEVNDAARAKFYDLHASHGLRNSTLSKKISILNWFLRWCNSKGYSSAPVTPAHLRNIPRTVTFLEWEELLHLYTFDFGRQHSSLAHVRDIFCLCAFTGLRYSDAAALRPCDIVNDTIYIVTQKTSDPISIPLNEYSRAILDRYRTGHTRLLNAPSNQAANRLLKDAAILAQFDRPVRQVFYRGNQRCEEEQLMFEDFSTHYARRTFIVHSIRLGIPAEVVMRFTGHSDYEAMKPYIAIVDDLKRDAMQKFNEAK